MDMKILIDCSIDLFLDLLKSRGRRHRVGIERIAFSMQASGNDLALSFH